MDHRRSRVLLALGLSALPVGCGKDRTPPASAPPDVASSPAPAAEVEAAEPRKLTAEDAIGSTVLIATKWGHGTGVFVGEDGWILTNHHVIAPGINEDFGFEATVTIPKVNEDGSVAPGEKVHAVAHKVDPKRDLALLKVVEPQGPYPSLRLASTDPRPGRPVTAIGNAGVGFGWALKQCTINAIGTAESLASVIVQMDRSDVSEADRKRVEEEVAKAVTDLGKQIQTDCNVLPGDSGGPLVDRETNELVGLNVAVRPAVAGLTTLGSVALHVHIGEIRSFMKKVPDAPSGLPPDPWQIGSQGSFADADDDGEIDTLHFQGFCGDFMPCVATFSDLDQSTFREPGTPIPNPMEARRDRSFDAEIAVVHWARPPRTGGPLPVADVMVYVDTDADRKFDKLLVKDAETNRIRGYSLDEQMYAQRDAALDDYAFTKVPDLFTRRRVKRKAALVAAALVGGETVEANPDRAHALSAVFGDASQDGTFDTLSIGTRLDSRVLIDVRQTSLQKRYDDVQARVAKTVAGNLDKEAERETLAERVVLRQIRRGRMHGDVLVVMGSPTRVFYDTDTDGKYDLLLEGRSVDTGFALGAYHVDGKGRRPAPEHVGRKLLRPGLMKNASHAEALGERFARLFPGAPAAQIEDGVTSLPSTDVGEQFVVSEFPGCDRKVFAVGGRTSTLVLMDLDANAFTGKRKKATPKEVIEQGKLDPELAWVLGPGLSWVFYDRDDDGKYDLVLVEQLSSRRVAAAYVIGRDGTLTPDAAQVGKPIFTPDLFEKKGLRTSLDALRTGTCGKSL